MKRKLAIDIGNSRLKIGIFSGDNLVMIDTLDNSEWDQPYIDGWYNRFLPDEVIIASTIGFSEKAKNWIYRRGAMVVLPEMRYPFKILYKTLDTLGQDRLAAVSAVYSLYKRKNVLIIDAGTCITYDFLSESGIYVGGNISPGIQMRLAAMHYYTENLPRVFMSGEFKWLGQSTEEAIRAGGAAMAIMEAQGMISYLEKKFGDLTIVLTGGDYSYFVRHLEGEKFVEPNLVLLGLNEIMKNNEI